MSATNRVIYCSQYRHSLYVVDYKQSAKKNMLKCALYRQALVPALLPTDCTRASTCPLFEPECKDNVLFKNTHAFNQQNALSRAGQ